jgi:hypothetical protein
MRMALLLLVALAGGKASYVKPESEIPSSKMAKATAAARQGIAQLNRQTDLRVEPTPHVDYEQLVRALRAIHSTKPTCTMRIIEAESVDPGIELAVRPPVDSAMVREADCR